MFDFNGREDKCRHVRHVFIIDMNLYPENIFETFHQPAIKTL